MAATLGSLILEHASAVVTHPPDVRQQYASSLSASSPTAHTPSSLVCEQAYTDQPAIRGLQGTAAQVGPRQSTQHLP